MLYFIVFSNKLSEISAVLVVFFLFTTSWDTVDELRFVEKRQHSGFFIEGFCHK